MTKPAENPPLEARTTKAKKPIRKWLIRGVGIVLLCLGIPVTFLLNPSLLYAHHTVHQRFTIYHSTPLDPVFRNHLDTVARHLDQCELAAPELRIDICLNEGSRYPELCGWFFQPTFARSFLNKMLLMGQIDWVENSASFPGTKWNLQQLVTHEAVHCLQLRKLGVRKMNPVVPYYPPWKIEGYAEYVARQNADQMEVAANIRRLLETEAKGSHNGRVVFADGSDVDIPYYGYWLLVQYCLDVKKLTYAQLLDDKSPETTIRDEMMRWYQSQSNPSIVSIR